MHDELWKRVERALDARLDPFEDPDLAAALGADPDADRATRRLVARLEMLQGPQSRDLDIAGRPKKGRRGAADGGARRVAAVAALLAVAATVAVTVTLVLQRSAHDPRDEQPEVEMIDTVTLVVQHTVPPPPRGARVVLESRRVLGWTLEGNAP